MIQSVSKGPAWHTADHAEMGIGVINSPAGYLVPYRLATFGDSRANSGSHVTTTSAGSVGGSKVAGCLCKIRGDMQIVFNGGLSGDTAANWNSAARVSSSQTVAALLATNPDLCLIQYGINDVIGGVAAATIVGYLKAAISKILGGGVPVVFESINPCTPAAFSFINGYSVGGGYGANYATKAATLLEINAEIRAWLAQFPGSGALYVDTSSVSTGRDGYAKTDQTYADGTHMSPIGTTGSARIIDAEIQSMFPRRSGQRIKALYPNGLNRSLLNPTAGRAENFVVVGVEVGAATATYQIILDEDGDLCQQYTVTVTGTGGTAATLRFDMLPDWRGATPFWTAAAGDIMQGSFDYTIDDGAGGAPIAYGVFGRGRAYYDATYNTRTTAYSDHGLVGPQNSTDHPSLPAAEAGKILTPRLALDTDSSHLTVSTALQCYVQSNKLGSFRLRIKNPQWCKVA
jgi:lysophospholipase L1-like esterase